MSETPVLLDLGTTALAHQAEVDEVKRQMGIDHNFFDCWIYGFLENKSFDINEAVAKLKRREDFEKTELASIEVSDWMMESMKLGIIQVIGCDKEGRVALYVRTARDKPSKAHREEARKNFDMFVSYSTRLRKDSKRCQLVMLINQDKASLFSNVDMSFQADIALRIAKFYPGCIDKMYICKMNGTLATFAKPVFSRLPAIVSDRIKIFSNGDLSSGKLLELFDEDVLPIELGGKNNCDQQERYDEFSNTICSYFAELKSGISSGMSVKDWELLNLRKTGAIPDPDGRAMTVNMSSTFTGRQRGEDTLTDDLHTCDTFEGATASYRGYSMTGVDFMESTENFFRKSITEGYDREWLDLVKQELRERVEHEAKSGILKKDSLLAPLPPSIRMFCRGFLWLCMVVMSFFFLLGTFFIMVIGTTNMTYVFFSMQYQSYYNLPYGVAFVVIASQFTIFVSRGFELTRSTYNGQLVSALRGFGNRAHAFQIAVCMFCVVASLAIFCATTVKYGAATGLHWCVSFGWFVAGCLIFVYHVIFAFGFKKTSKGKPSDKNRTNDAEPTIYLFLDFAIGKKRDRTPTAEIITGCLLGIFSFGFGFCYTLSGHVGFLSACVVSLALLYYLIYASASVGNQSGSVVLNSTLFTSVIWLSAAISIYDEGWSDGWGGSIVIAGCIAAVYLFVSYSAFFNVFGNRLALWILRLGWLLFTALHLACVIVLLVINYKAGLFTGALFIHLVICAMRTNNATNQCGVFFTIATFTFIFIACCMYGNTNANESYAASVSQSILPTFDATYNDVGAQNTFSPACRRFYHSYEAYFSVVGASLFSKLGYNHNPLLQEEDLNTWFPLYSVNERYSTSDGFMTATVFSSESENTTVISYGNDDLLIPAVDAVTMWLESFSLSLLSIVMDEQLLVNSMEYLTFVRDMMPLRWKDSVSELQEFTDTVACGTDNTVYLVGYSTMGVVATYMSLDSCERKCILFATPSSAAKRFQDMTETALSRIIVDIVPTTFNFFVWGRSPTVQYFPCSASDDCYSLEGVIDHLNSFCIAQ